MSDYASCLMSWLSDTNSKYRGIMPEASGNLYSMLNSTPSYLPSYRNSTPSPEFNSESSRNDAANNWKLYAMAWQVYAQLLQKWHEGRSPQNEEPVYHWTPVDTPYGTKIIDLNSGRMVYVKRSSHGMDIMGTHKDLEANFGRGMGSEAVKMAYDGNIYQDARPSKR